MKIYLSLFLILLCACAGFGQKRVSRKAAPRPSTVPYIDISNLNVETPPQIRQVMIEKISGEKLTGAYLGGNFMSVTIRTAGSNIKIAVFDIRNIKFIEEKKQ